MIKKDFDEIKFMQQAQIALNQSFKEDAKIAEQKANKNPILKLIDNIKHKSEEKKIIKDIKSFIYER
ncbi:MAG: hypothetical protein ACI4N3_01710 [Alphaproteobacteria bacterium]